MYAVYQYITSKGIKSLTLDMCHILDNIKLEYRSDKNQLIRLLVSVTLDTKRTNIEDFTTIAKECWKL